MSDTYIQNVAHNVDDIDQPVELEGVRLDWSQSRFVKTDNGSYNLRTAPATSEFWRVWERNKMALKSVGISCKPLPEVVSEKIPQGHSHSHQPKNWEVQWWIDVSDLDDITPENDICIPEDKSYTLCEVIDLVQQTLDKIGKKSEHEELQYSSTDVYWLLYDMLRYINQNVSGVFVLGQIQKDTYRVKYMAEDFSKQKSSRKLKKEVNQTARYLEELTGRKPSWGDKE